MQSVILWLPVASQLQRATPIYGLKTHLPLVPHICVSESGQHWFRQWLVAYSAPSHYLTQCWVIVNWTLRSNLQWIQNQNLKLFFHENASENIICEMAAILSRGRWVLTSLLSEYLGTGVSQRDNGLKGATMKNLLSISHKFICINYILIDFTWLGHNY